MYAIRSYYGIDMKPTDVSFRCNLVTLSDEEKYSDKTIIDYCADDISTEEAKILIDYLAEHFDNNEFKLFSGRITSYNVCYTKLLRDSHKHKLYAISVSKL